MGIMSPIDAVIVDTCIFHKEQCDFLGIQNPILPAFLDMLNEKRIKLLSHPVLYEEIKEHISKSEVINKLSNLKTSLRKYKNTLPLVGLSADDIAKSIDELDIEGKLINAFNAAFKNAEELPYPDVKDVFTLYFAGQPPFSSTGDKKSEFPDAFVILALKQYIQSHPSKCVLILTNDSDWKNALADIPRAILADSIGAGMRTLQNCDELLPIFNEALPDIEQHVLSLLEFESFELMGFETIDDPEITDVSVKSISDMFVPLKITDNSVLLRTTIELEVEGSATVLDEDRSIWNTEDKSYIFAVYSDVAFKKALAQIECDIEITFDPDDHRSYIDVESVKLNVRFNVYVELDEDTATFTDHELDTTANMMDAMEEYFRH